MSVVCSLSPSGRKTNAKRCSGLIKSSCLHPHGAWRFPAPFPALGRGHSACSQSQARCLLPCLLAPRCLGWVPRVSGCSCAPRHDPSLRGHTAFHGASLAQASSFYSACWGAIRNGSSGSNAPWRSLKHRAAWQPWPQPPVSAAPARRGEGKEQCPAGSGSGSCSG